MRTRRAAATALAVGAVAIASGAAPAVVAASQATPVVLTGQAAGVAQNTATLMGTVDTEGSQTVYEFDFGVDTSYGTRIFGEAGNEPGEQAFSSPLQGLAPGTTYHYRIVATNAVGSTYGTDQTFTTASYPSATLATPSAPPLVPTPLLVIAGGSSSTGGGSTAVAATASARTATAGTAQRRSLARDRRSRRRSSRSVHAQGVNRKGRR
jgi:hypothetical protein